MSVKNSFIDNDKMQSIGSKGRKGDPMNKRIPENPKYKHVQSTLDTGKSLTKYMRKIEDIRQNYKFRKDEIFKRMKITTFAQLAIQVQRISELEAYADIPDTPGGGERPDSTDAELRNLGGGTNGAHSGGSPVPSLAITEGDYGRISSVAGSTTERSTFLSVSRGVGELDVNQPPPAPVNMFVDDLCPYLLLDVRDSDEYKRCHIITASSYPKAELSKATNYESKEMLQYKNKEGKIIIIYDEDERLGPQCAQTLVQRGYDNLFMLSGGLKVAYKIFPEGFITGTPPPTVLSSKPKNIIPADQKSFTTEDIDKMDMYLDSSLQDHSTGGRLSKNSSTASRMSYTSGTSSMGSSRTSSQASTAPSHLRGRPAFKPP